MSKHLTEHVMIFDRKVTCEYIQEGSKLINVIIKGSVHPNQMQK